MTDTNQAGQNLSAPLPEGQQPQPENHRKRYVAALAAILAVAIGLGAYFLVGSKLFKGFIGEQYNALTECVTGIPEDILINSEYPVTVNDGCTVQLATDGEYAEIVYARFDYEQAENSYDVTFTGETNLGDSNTIQWYVNDVQMGTGEVLDYSFAPAVPYEVKMLISGYVNGKPVELVNSKTVVVEELPPPAGETVLLLHFDDVFTAQSGDTVKLITFAEPQENAVFVRFNDKQWDFDIKEAAGVCEITPDQALKDMAASAADNESFSTYFTETQIATVAAAIDKIKQLIPVLKELIQKGIELLEEARILIAVENVNRIATSLNMAPPSEARIAEINGYIDLLIDYGDKARLILEGNYETQEDDPETEDIDESDPEMVANINYYVKTLLNSSTDELYRSAFVSGPMRFKPEALENEACVTALRELGITNVVNGDGYTTVYVDSTNIPGECFPEESNNNDNNFGIEMLEVGQCNYLPDELIIPDEVAGKINAVVDEILEDKNALIDILDRIKGLVHGFNEDESKNICTVIGNTVELGEYFRDNYFETPNWPPFSFEHVNVQKNQPVEIDAPYLTSEEFSIAELYGDSPINGTLEDIDDDTLGYTPNDDFEGFDGFTYLLTLPEGSDYSVGNFTLFDYIRGLILGERFDFSSRAIPKSFALTCIEVGGEGDVEVVEEEEEVVEDGGDDGETKEIAITITPEVVVGDIEPIVIPIVIETTVTVEGSGGGGGGGTSYPQCSDNQNNDDDNFIDFPADPGCNNADDNTESPDPVTRIVTQCSDGIDNDGNGFIDYPEDNGCINENDNTEQTKLEVIASVEGLPEAEIVDTIIKANNCLSRTPQNKITILEDIKTDHPAAEMIANLQKLAYNGEPIIVGRKVKDKYYFEDDKPILRPEFFKLAAWPSCLAQSATAKGLWDTKKVKNYKDKEFDEKFWAYEIVNALTKLNVVEGYDDGTVGLNKNITRAEIIKLLLDAYALRVYLDEHDNIDFTTYDKEAVLKEVFADSLAKYEKSPFPDISELNKPWFYNYAIIAYDFGIVKSDLFNGDEFARRDEAATMVYNFFIANVKKQQAEAVETGVETVKEITFIRTFMSPRYGSF